MCPTDEPELIVQEQGAWWLEPQLWFLLAEAEAAFLHLQLLCTDHGWVDGGIFSSMELKQMYLESADYFGYY